MSVLLWQYIERGGRSLHLQSGHMDGFAQCSDVGCKDLQTVILHLKSVKEKMEAVFDEIKDIKP